MTYLIVEDGIITNIIVCEDDDKAADFGAVPAYDGASIGAAYDPPEPPPTVDDQIVALEAENKLLRAQMSAQSDQLDFYEDCIAEMAAVVYA